MNREDEQLLRAFETDSWDLAQWNQRAHVALAYLYLEAHGFDGALERLREGIRDFNARHAIPETPTSGYHETTTVALLTLVDVVRRTYRQVFPVASSAEFCDTHPQLMSKHILRLYYSPECRMRPEAKTRFIEPDLAPLPKPR